MSDPAQSLSSVLRSAPEAARLLARWEASQRAARVIAPVCRALASGFDPLAPGRCELREALLLLTATSTAQAAKLRQATPRGLSALAVEGIQIIDVRVRVQPGVTGYPEQGSAPASSPDAAWLKPGAGAGEQVDQLARQVRESPLKRAVERLAATLRKRARG